MIAATQSNHPMGALSQPKAACSSLEDALVRIRNAQMRITKPRIAIIESLMRHEGPVSIECIHQEVGASVCDLVTVYRCLSAFETIKIVRRSYLHNGTCLYELTLGEKQHYHVSCKACGKTEKVDYFSVDGMERLLNDRGYSEVTHVVGFFGICPSCQQVAPSREIAPPMSRSIISPVPEVQA